MPQLVGTTPPPARTGPADCCQSRNLSSSVVANVGSPDPPTSMVGGVASAAQVAIGRKRDAARCTQQGIAERAAVGSPGRNRRAPPSVLSRLLMIAPRRKAARRRYLDRDQEDRSLAQRLRDSARPGCCSARRLRLLSAGQSSMPGARSAAPRSRAHRLGVAWLLSPAARPVRHDGVQARHQRDRRGYRRRARCEHCRAGAGDRRGRVVFAATAGFEA
jgi:hypothetical protein